MDGGDGGAGDGSFDACECIYNHNAGMQRLLSFLRQSQTECTEGDCLTEVPGQPGATQNGDPGNYTGAMLMMAWMMVALVLYFMRPAALRRTNEKSGGGGDRDRSHRDEDHLPPAPPIM
ncbi:hypothetical protein BV898_17910 [Hypsibius exemplaris]|uniref:Small integral membrane protein 14 n=1 Tax=Hypsibius exemplaris TaxID=2072580 RepID=A0A9X6NIS1_HYPEX|nr:hypothetical protein BV898_17910 [Hypsibius exemplaris]